MKNINRSMEYIFIPLAKSICCICLLNLVQRGTLCSANYIFADQKIREKLILYNSSERY